MRPFFYVRCNYRVGAGFTSGMTGTWAGVSVVCVLGGALAGHGQNACIPAGGGPVRQLLYPAATGGEQMLSSERGEASGRYYGDLRGPRH